jgi:HK97 family phage major capsid protein
MTPKTVGAYTDFSRKLMLQSSIDVETMVRNELATVLALEIDRVGLYGLGNTNQPLGLKLTTGINTVNLGAAAPTYAELVQMETEIAADNADIGAMAYISNATIYGGLKTTEKAANTAQFVLEPGGTVNGYPIVRSNQVASGDVWFGVWSNLILGLWSGLDLTVDPYANATSGGVRVIALQDLDYGCRHPECFVRANDSL